MKFKIAAILFLLITCELSYSQETTQTLNGEVTFVTSNNVYVRFDNTDNIEIGKTLNINGVACLQVTDKSSTSLVCTVLNDCAPQKGDAVSYQYTVVVEETPVEETPIGDEPVPNIPPTQVVQPSEEEKSTSLYKEDIRGRVTLSSYNTFSDLRENTGRFRTRVSVDAKHIGDSKFSVQSFLTYRSITDGSNSGRDNIFNVFNLNLRYDILPDLSATAGRFINPKASSLGAVDGLMVEKYFNNFYVGAVGGFRPDFEDYGFNSDLLQYGGYVGIETNTSDFFSQTTLGAMEQTNAGATDRRFIYFQHNSTIASDLNLFSSAEMDIYSTSGTSSTRLTNLYLSARYRFSRAANLMVSYDSRKQIIYYETYDSMIDQLLDEDLTRQGVRVRLNVRPHKLLWLGASYARRFQNNSDNQSDNIYAYATLSKIPKIGGRLSLAYNNNATNYLKSSIISARYGREFFENKLSTEFYYRLADYNYENDNLDDVSINYFGGTLSYRISRTWQFSVSGEMSTSDLENNFRFYTRLTKRFASSKKR